MFWCFPPFFYIQKFSDHKVLVPSCSGYRPGRRCTRLSAMTDQCYLSQRKRGYFPYGRRFKSTEGCLSASTHFTCIMGIVLHNILGLPRHPGSPRGTATTTCHRSFYLPFYKPLRVFFKTEQLLQYIHLRCCIIFLIILFLFIIHYVTFCLFFWASVAYWEGLSGQHMEYKLPSLTIQS